MPDPVAIQRSVGNITAMLACCALIFGVLILRSLQKFLPDALESTGAKTPKDQAAVSVKMIALMMAVPVVFFLAVIVGEFPTLWHAFPYWCLFIGLLVLALAALIISLFWLDQEHIEEYTIEFDQRAGFDKKMKKEDAEKKIVTMGFGLWIVGLGASYLWLLHLASISLRDVLRWF
jgi:hypothetical protein